MAKIGRNDRCPCGSGRKYKHCCSGKEVASFIPEDAWTQDPEWYKIRQIESEVIEGILDFAAEEYGKNFLPEALAEFGFWGEYQIPEQLFDTIFLPWLIFNWRPETDEQEGSEQALGLQYLEENEEQLDSYHQAFILTACAQPFTFFTVTGVISGKSLELRDIFLNRTFTVKEAKASTTLRRGDIIYARVLPLGGQAIILGMAPTVIPPRELTGLLDIRDEIKKEMREEGFDLNLASLCDWDVEMRAAYLSVAEFLANPPRPTLQNTDGDPFIFVRLYFELRCSPQEAFDGLRSLSLYQSPTGVPEEAVRDETGNLVEVSFDWSKKGNKKYKDWNNTILGTLTIDGATLTVEVNSEERAKKIRTEIAKRLGKQAIFKRDERESVEDKLEEMSAQSDSPAVKEQLREQEEFASRPEVQELLEQQMQAHWEAWYNQRIPALQNKTPLQAARTKAGRERLEALLLDFERNNEEASQPHLRVDIEAMRKKLGL